MYNFDNTAGYEKWLNDFKDEQRPDGELPRHRADVRLGIRMGQRPGLGQRLRPDPLVSLPVLRRHPRPGRALRRHETLRRLPDRRSKDHLSATAWATGSRPRRKRRWPSRRPATTTSMRRSSPRSPRCSARPTTPRNTPTWPQGSARRSTAQLYKGDGIYANGSQTALSCAVYQGLGRCPKRRPASSRNWPTTSKQNDDHLDTGILGAKYLFHALSDNGRHDLAYRIATQTTPPSYGDWIRRGATTLWEDWGDGASRNHIMFGDISAWFYQTLAGINLDPRAAGLQAHHHPPAAGRRSEMGPGRARIACTEPSPAAGIASAGHCRQRHRAGQHHGRGPRSRPLRRAVTESGRPAAKAPGVKFLRMEAGAAVFEVESGKYEFLVK